MTRHTPTLSIAVIVVLLVTGAVAVFYTKDRTRFPSSASEKPNSKNPPTLAANAEVYTSTESGEVYTPQASSQSATPIPSAAPIDSYIYEGASVLSSSPSKLEMESKANANTITNWYKEKIKAANFNAKSFSQTNTNGTILNKLSAAKPGEKINITIKKDQNESNVTITVDRL